MLNGLALLITSSVGEGRIREEDTSCSGQRCLTVVRWRGHVQKETTKKKREMPCIAYPEAIVCNEEKYRCVKWDNKYLLPIRLCED